MCRADGVSIYDAAGTLIVEIPPLPQLPLKLAQRIRTAQRRFERLFDLKCAREGRQRVNGMKLVRECPEAIANVIWKKFVRPCVSEDSAVALIILQQVIHLDGDVGQFRRTVWTCKPGMSYARQKQREARCSGLMRIRICLDSCAEIVFAKKSVEPLGPASGNEQSQEAQIANALDPTPIVPHRF